MQKTPRKTQGRWRLQPAWLQLALGLPGLVACSDTEAPTAPAQDVKVGPTTVLAPLAGTHSTPAAGQSNIGFHGTDLGYTYVHDGQLRIVFGDTWASGNLIPIGLWSDDSQAVICLSDDSTCPGGPGAPAFPDGDAVESYLSHHPRGAGQLSWQRPAPPLYFRLNAFGLVAPLAVYRGGVTGPLLNMGATRTPIAAFSNGRTGAAAGAFALFNRGVSVQCSGGAPPGCPEQLVCDTGLGSYLGLATEEAIPCVLGTPACAPIAAGGFCVDDTNSLHEPPGDEAARLLSVASKLEVGSADPELHEQYYTRPWVSRRFYNSAVRAANDFSPTRRHGLGNDYTLPDENLTGRERLFIWGRPGFVGAKANQRGQKLYFAYVDLPSRSARGDFEWSPSYYTGLRDGVPQFSKNQRLAKALDLSGSPTKDSETWDVVGQMSVAFLPELQRWVMLYGGDVNDGLADLFSGGQGAQVARDPEGAIHVRFSVGDDPWGPWTAPQQLFKAGNPETTPPVSGSQYAAGGILHHGDCAQPDCAPGEPAFGNAEYGFFYAPNIIPEWTEDRGSHVDIYWNLSTWNPYQVVLVKSRLDK